MVDFNSEGAFTANKSHILELVILGRRDELINTFQLWKENDIENTGKTTKLKAKLVSILFSMFLELERPLYRKLTKTNKETNKTDTTKYDELKKIIFSKEANDDEVIKAYMDLNNVLDELNLTKIDNKRIYDTTSIETENLEKGL